MTEEELNLEQIYESLQEEAFKDIEKQWVSFFSSPFNWCPDCDLPLEIIEGGVWKGDLLVNIYKCPKCGHIEEVEI